MDDIAEKTRPNIGAASVSERVKLFSDTYGWVKKDFPLVNWPDRILCQTLPISLIICRLKSTQPRLEAA